jgi:hypothetical protein
MEPVPRALLEQIQRLAPSDADAVPLEWAYDCEDYNLAQMPDLARPIHTPHDTCQPPSRPYPFSNGRPTIAVGRQEVFPPPQENPPMVKDKRRKVGLWCGPRPLGQCRAVEPYFAPWVAFDALRWTHNVQHILLEQVWL